MQDFDQLGRVEAVKQLFEGSGYDPFQSGCFSPAGGSSIVQASRLMLEGIDFDLV